MEENGNGNGSGHDGPSTHATTESIPPLPSAPPSGNNNYYDGYLYGGTVAPLPPPPVMTIRSPPVEEPPEIPSTAFCPPTIRYLAHRQCHIPVLVLGTESAHKLAWKNRLRLVDLLQGLARTLPDYTNRQIPPFRSIAKFLSLQWKDVPLTFVTPEQLAQPMSHETAQELLQQQAQLRDTDGLNLTQELDLLEDQVDALLQDPPNSSSITDLATCCNKVSRNEKSKESSCALL